MYGHTRPTCRVAALHPSQDTDCPRSSDNQDYYPTGVGSWTDESPAVPAEEIVQQKLDDRLKAGKTKVTKRNGSKKKGTGMDKGKSKKSSKRHG
jgi:hypothetical protein